MPLTFRRLAPDDAVTYRALMLEAYTLHPDAFTSDVAEREALPISWWQNRLDNAPSASEAVFGALEDGHLLGNVGLSMETRKKARHKCTLFGMYVPLAHRARGIGQQLMNNVLAYATSQTQLLVVQLTVTQGNAGAQALYERMGFVQFGLEPLAVSVGGGFVSKVHMWKDLRD
ncbi:Acetyltransferase [Pseudomonas coronafaciens pv. atropurpurea]|uniref:GNAT family N-acetyltransferase n=1 Tax=Pseudomonas coronafaciens TaxID=53409 RepID=UPI0006D5E7B9|nr:GNAT family N-acetyltransferase [Pseudomonas coronafaciens]KPW34634.1 Acetyltransferase [Pseudomonas coronafaciens pv. atropurpurea]RMT54199.1 Acetyltransferase [Pseudomonas coronafaciens pv. atropurpurea]